MTVDTAKCNITKHAVAKLHELYWGFNNSGADCDDVEDIILENYIEYTGCSTGHIICNPARSCSNNTKNITCTLLIDTLNIDLEESVFTITPNIEDGVEPYTYLWEYDNSIFDLTSVSVTQSSLILTVKDNVDPLFVISRVKLTMIDAEECSSEKICYLMPGDAVECGTGYIPCPTSNNLQVIRETPFPDWFPIYVNVIRVGVSKFITDPHDTTVLTPGVRWEQVNFDSIFNYGWESHRDIIVQLRFNDFPAPVGSIGDFNADYDIYASTDLAGTDKALTDRVIIDSYTLNSPSSYTVTLHYFADSNHFFDFLTPP